VFKLISMVNKVKVRCRYCEKDAVVRIPYAKLNLCSDHFNEFIVSKVRRSIERYKMINPKDKVLLAVSGGKDSITLTHIMYKILRELDFKLIVLHIDLGIGEYSKKSREIVENLCKSLSIDYIVFDLKNDLSLTLPEFIQKLKTRRICSLCGIIKRYIMNAVALELNVDSVATAHHADDVLTYIIKDFILQDYEAMRKLVPISIGVPGIVAKKIKPMYEVYEYEAAMYVVRNKLEFIDIECPFKKVKSLEDSVRKFIEDLEKRSPGIKISFLRKFAKMYIGREVEGFRKCRVCGLASSGDICSFCRLTEKSFGKPLGSKVREVIREKIGKAVV